MMVRMKRIILTKHDSAQGFEASSHFIVGHLILEC